MLEDFSIEDSLLQTTIVFKKAVCEKY